MKRFASAGMAAALFLGAVCAQAASTETWSFTTGFAIATVGGITVESTVGEVSGSTMTAGGNGLRSGHSGTSHSPGVVYDLSASTTPGNEALFQWTSVGRDGLVDPVEVARVVTERTLLVSVMAANNEIGVLQPIEDIARLCHALGAVFHTDASQAIGKVPFDVETVGADLVSFTAHKFYGPKGVGALWVRRKSVEVALQMHGGGHERGLRSGTLNVTGIVGLGKACELCRLEGEQEARRLAALRDRLLASLRAQVPDLVVNGSLAHRLPQNLNVSFPGIDAESLAVAMDGIAISSGSACATGKPKPSAVLKALGVADDLAFASLRFGLGRWTTDEGVEFVTAKTVSVIKRLREVRAALEG